MSDEAKDLLLLLLRERLEESYIDALRESAPNLLAVVIDGSVGWERAWRVWKRRARLGDGLHKITDVAADPDDVDLDLVPNEPLVGSDKNLTRAGVVTAIEFLQKAVGLMPEEESHE